MAVRCKGDRDKPRTLASPEVTLLSTVVIDGLVSLAAQLSTDEAGKQEAALRSGGPQVAVELCKDPSTKLSIKP